MLRNSMKRFLREFGENNDSFPTKKLQKAETFLKSRKFHNRLRNEIIMTTIPKKKHTNSKDQTHKIKDAFTRVSLKV